MRNPIRRHQIWFFCVLIPVFWAQAESPTETPSLPRIEFDALEHDFGHQISGPALMHSFVFHNRGSAPLFIEKVKAG